MKWIIVITMFLLGVSYSMNYETTVVNGYKVVKGERAFIDLSKVPADSYEPGKLTIKLKEGFSTKSQERFINSSSKGYVEVGIESLDLVNKSIGAQKYDRKFYSLYEIPAGTIHSVAKFSDRHKAWGFDRVYEITFDANQDVIAAVKQYASQEGIEYAEPVYKKKLHAPVRTEQVTPVVNTDNKADGSKWVPNDTYYTPNQWHYNNFGQTISSYDGTIVGVAGVDVRAVAAWDIEQGNPLFCTAVIDQGIDYDHPDIAANMWTGRGWNFTDNTSTINPGDHGSHTSATISGVTNNGIGIAGLAGGNGTAGTGSKVMSCQVFDDTSGGFDTAFIWSADQGASIAQNSWGYTSAGTFEQTVLDAIDYFNANGGQDGGLVGGIVIFSAGNDGVDDDWYPAYYGGTMAVASINNNGKKSSFSNYGTWVDISAPGGGVYSCNGTGGYMIMDGTSMACPHVSGAAAMIVANSEGILTAADLRTILLSSVWNVYTYNSTYLTKLGSGALDASAALVLTQEYLGGVPTADNFAATGTSTSQNNLSWALNEFNDNVLVAWALDGGTIGDPVDQTVYSVGNTLPGGGTVIYYGNATSYNHTGLTPQTTYDYKVWSRAAAERQDNQGEWYQVGTYSNEKVASAMTLMAPLPPSAASLGFENSGSIPLGWTQEGSWTFVTTATRPTAPSEGSYFAFFNTANSTKKIVTPRFDLTTHTGVTINFDYCVSSRKSGPTTYYDRLKVYYKTSLAGSWVLLSPEYSGAYTTWQTATLNISDAVRTNDFYFAFEAIEGAAIGYGVSVDDIVINGTSGSAPPAVPTLALPANASSTADLTPTFDWNDVSGATSYTIQIDDLATFASPNYTNSPTTSTYTPAANLAVGTWYWRVQATNTYGSSAYTSGWSVILGNAPAVPTLALPANASSTSDLTPTFDWNDVSGATAYTIQIDNDVAFGSVDYTNSPTTSTYTPAANLAVGTWYWRVLATNAFGSSAYTASWSVILGSAPAVPTLALPANASSTSDLTPTFDWNDVSGATSYTIQIDNDVAFGSVDYTNSPTTSTYTPAANLAVGTWYWRVLATNAFGSSSYTAGWSVILGSAPAVPTLSLPANASTTADLTPTFDWNDVSGATAYTIQIDNDVAFGSVDYTNSPTTSTYTPAANLATGTWYWRVLATNAFGSSSYTAGWSVILGSAPAAPTLATPTDASTLYILKPVFDWNNVSGATSYTILVDNNATFASPEVTNSPAVSTYTPAVDLALGTYYWKVLSTNAFGSSAYSATWTVTLAPLTAPINVITSVVGTNLTVSWNAVGGATSYDVYSSADPYGTYTFVSNVATNSYVTTTASSKLFWYIKAKN
jgi:subtilisin family serine protease